MPDIQDLPTLPAGGHERPPSFDDEKKEPLDDRTPGGTPGVLVGDAAYDAAGKITNEKLAAVAATHEVGDVYEDVRAIDLDESGKERPIEDDIDWAVRLVSLEDDPAMRWNTFRTWFLGLGLSCFGAVLGQLFYFRPQTIQVSQLFLQIFGYLMGKALERFVPGVGEYAVYKTSDSAFWRFFNHGPFNIKEHVAITIMASTASTNAQGIGIFAAQDLYYNLTANPGTAIFTLLASQFIGYSLAGLLRSLLVYPTFAKYPILIPSVQLFDAMHRGKGIFLQKKRVRFFWYTFIGIFVWEWFPEYFATTLNGISIFCLAMQHSAWASRIFGGAGNNEGLGMFAISLDWAYVGSGGGTLGSMFTPLHVSLALYGGTAVCIVSFCAVYAKNVWKSQNFPFLSQRLWLENGSAYPQLDILNEDFSVNRTKLEAVGLPWYAGTQILYKASRTMYIGAAVTHFALWHAKDLWAVFRAGTDKEPDPHYAKMRVYREVPWWWYGALGIATLITAIVAGTFAHSGLPWWGFLLAILFSLFFIPIVGTLYATVGYPPSTQNFMQLVGGCIIPGNPVANMYFTLYGYNSVMQAYDLLRDLKLGQYCKLPPRATFYMQTVGTVVGAVLNYIIMKSVITNNRDILLDVQGTVNWSGQQVQAFNSAAISLGALAKDLYAPSARYGWVPLSIFSGLVFPIPFWLLHKKYPGGPWHLVFTPVLMAELGILSVGINSSVFTSFLLAIISQYWLRKYHPRWFRKYNFLLSASLDGGTQVMIFVWSFAVGGAGGKTTLFPNWALNPGENKNPDYCLRLND